MGSFQQPAVPGFPELEVVSQSIIEMEIKQFYIEPVHIFDFIATFGTSVTVDRKAISKSLLCCLVLLSLLWIMVARAFFDTDIIFSGI